MYTNQQCARQWTELGNMKKQFDLWILENIILSSQGLTEQRKTFQGQCQCRLFYYLTPSTLETATYIGFRVTALRNREVISPPNIIFLLKLAQRSRSELFAPKHHLNAMADYSRHE